MRKVIVCFVALLTIAAAATGPARAQSNSEELFYTLDGTQTGSSGSYSQSSYSDPSEITQGGITWQVKGNTTQNPWRIGGKSLNAVDRDVYCEGSLDETITKVNLDFGTADNITVNSVTMIVASDAAFNNVIESKSVNFSTNSNVDVTPGTGIEWTDAYYKFVFNVSVSGSSNKFLQLKSIKFYYTSGGSTPEPEPEPAVPHTVRFAEGMSGWQVQDVTASSSAVAPAVLENVMAGDSLVVTAPASLPGKVKSVKAVKYVPPAVITWNTTNVLKEANQNDELNRSHRTPLTYEGITISFSGNDVSSFNPYSTARENPALECHGDDGDSFTFTAPSGKKFTKIEINDNSYINFDAYGDWTKPENNKIVWRGTAANAVTLGSVFTLAGNLNSIVFTLIDAQ